MHEVLVEYMQAQFLRIVHGYLCASVTTRSDNGRVATVPKILCNHLQAVMTSYLPSRKLCIGIYLF